MTDSNPEFTLSDITWLTALARSLTRDGALADDLVQQTWMAARKSESPNGVSRPWLARVLRRLHLRFLRTEGRRAARERAVSSSETPMETSELVERAELQRTLADCLLGLEEPYRGTLMRVAFEELTPREIAEREEVSVESVRRRLRKARELFREKLEREYGREWKQWYAALLPYAQLPLPGEVAPTSVATPSGLSTTKLTLGGLILTHSLSAPVTAVLLGGLAVSTVLWNQRGGAEALESIQSSTRDDERASELVAAPSTQEASVGRREVVAPPETNSESSSAPAESGAPASYMLSGTLLVRDESDREYASANGEFALWTSTGTVRVPVVHGAWSLELAADQSLNFHVFHETELLLDDRAGVITGGTELFREERTLAEDTELELVGRWLRMHRFNVLDAETRQHLSGVEVVERSFFETGRFPHPGAIDEGEIVQQGAFSPIDIRPRSESQSTYYIGTTGYAWARVEVDHMQGGETEVLLTPGADLSVRFGGGHEGPVEFAIHVAGDTGQQIEWDTTTDAELRFRGMRLGRYVLAARADMRAREVRQEFEVLPGQNEVVLEVPTSTQRRAPVAGTLLLDAVTASMASGLMFREQVQWSLRPEDQGARVAREIPLSAMQRTDEGLLFDAGELFLGTYEVLLEGSPWRTTFRLEAEGATDLRFEVGSQGEVFVRLMETTTSEVIGASEQGLWFDPQFNLDEEVDVSFEESRQAWRIRGPAGWSAGSVWFYYDYATAEIELELREEPVEIEVQIEPYTTFGVDLYDGAERVNLTVSWIEAIEVTHAGTGEPSRSAQRLLSSGLGISVEEPGVHVISFGALEGYDPIPDRTVLLERGEHTQLRIELQRQ